MLPPTPPSPDGFEAEALRVLLENLPGVVYRCRNDPAWSMVFISPFVEALTGHSPEAFLKGEVTFASLIHEEDREAVWREVQASLEGHRPYRLTYRIQRLEGGFRWVREDGRGIFDEAGNLRWLDGVILDHTEQIEMERALRESEENLRMALRASQVGVWRWERGSQGLLRTDKVDQLFGFPAKAPDLRLGDFLARLDPADLAHINRLLAEASQLELEISLHPPGLPSRRAHVFTRVLKDEQGVIHVAMGTLRGLREGE